MRKFISFAAVLVVGAVGFGAVHADGQGAGSECQGLPSHSTLRGALSSAQAGGNGGFALPMWATIVSRDGIVCAVAFTGQTRGDQWPGSRVISAQKANTANAFSLPGLALSTANLYTAVQPGGSLFGLQASNPVDTSVAYGGNAAQLRSAERSDGGPKASVVSTSSAAVLDSTTQTAFSSVASASAAIPRAPITISRGERAARWRSTSFPLVSMPLIRSARTTSSSISFRNPARCPA